MKYRKLVLHKAIHLFVVILMKSVSSSASQSYTNSILVWEVLYEQGVVALTPTNSIVDKMSIRANDSMGNEEVLNIVFVDAGSGFFVSKLNSQHSQRLSDFSFSKTGDSWRLGFVENNNGLLTTNALVASAKGGVCLITNDYLDKERQFRKKIQEQASRVTETVASGDGSSREWRKILNYAEFQEGHDVKSKNLVRDMRRFEQYMDAIISE